MNVKLLVVVLAVFLVKFVVDAVGHVVHIAELKIAENTPSLCDVEGSFDKSATVQLAGVGVVVFMFVFAVAKVFLGHVGVGDVGDIAEVVAAEVLQRQAANDIPSFAFVVGVPNEAVSVLR